MIYSMCVCANSEKSRHLSRKCVINNLYARRTRLIVITKQMAQRSQTNELIERNYAERCQSQRFTIDST